MPSGSISETKKGIWKQNFLLFSYEKDYECYWHNESQPSTTDDKYLSFFLSLDLPSLEHLNQTKIASWEC